MNEVGTLACDNSLSIETFPPSQASLNASMYQKCMVMSHDSIVTTEFLSKKRKKKKESYLVQ